jgi:single-stranded DNA-binding protein
VWRGYAEHAAEPLRKDDRVVVIGRVRIRSYEQDGETRYATEIVAGSTRRQSNGKRGLRAAAHDRRPRPRARLTERASPRPPADCPADRQFTDYNSRRLCPWPG